MNIPADLLHQVEKVLLYPETELQWVFIGGGGIVVLLLIGKWFSTLLDYRKGFPKLVLALFLLVAAGILGMAAGVAYLEPLLNQSWWTIGSEIAGFVLAQAVLAWPLSKLLLGSDGFKVFFFSLGVFLVSWGGVFLVAQALQTGSDTGSRMEEIQERQRMRSGEDL
ncbi:MAG: hypothetical protein JJT75_13520 [Opitutales bacterium]|nr:hypothetical protein [Opitutales bacterium]MCH8540656.1 hypothetical protein [Opitutales bacterium]